MLRIGLLVAAVVVSSSHPRARPPGGTSFSPEWEPADPIPWEMNEAVTFTDVHVPVHRGIAAGIELSLIRRYQAKIAPCSIRRCLFGKSCSSFATEAIETRGGLLGLLLVLDRYFYRENPRSMRLYEWRSSPDGIMRPDDEWFLSRRLPEQEPPFNSKGARQ
jgi:putative component of membrane protein insertase Oxa1/YidC/SpoIIIJ protein YidD